MGDAVYCLRVPKMYNLRMDPYEHADVSGDGYDSWRVNNAYLTAEGVIRAAAFLQTFIQYPPSQEPTSFSVDQVVEGVNKRIEQLRAIQNSAGH